jgi:predicted ATP-grasp superfamily ATP-dependent carboligase
MELVLGQLPAGLRRPVLLAGFGGWGDAGNAASIALRHVLGETLPAASAMLDPSACYDFTVARPLTTRGPDGRGWSLEYPKLAFHPLRLAGADRDALVLLGPEPHFRWPEIAPAIIAYARAAGVELAVTLGAYVGPVSHRVAPIVRRTLDPTVDARLAALEIRDTDYEGPTAFATALLHAAAAAGLPAASLWVATPPYLQAGNPVAALALLEAAHRATGLPLDAQRLRETAAAFLRDVETALEEHPELAEQLKEMLEAEGVEADEAESQLGARPSGPDPDRPPPDAPPGLPTGKALVEAVERYLRQARDDSPPPPGP